MTDQVDARELLYEGKAKKLFATGDPKQPLQYFKDDATASNRKNTSEMAVVAVYQEIARRVGA